MKRRLSQLLVAGAAAVSFSVIAAGQQGQQAQQPGMQPGAAAGATQQPGMQVGQHDQQKIKKVQERLSERGHDVGPVDGIMGPQTQQALRDFQEKEGLEKTGQLDQQTLSALGIDEPAAAGATAPGIERDADRAPGAAAGATAPEAQQPGQVGAQQPEQDRATVGAGATTPGAQQQEQDRAPGAGAGATAPGTQLEQDRPAAAGATTPGAQQQEQDRAPGAGAGATAPGTQLEQDRATAGAGAERSEERRN